MNEDYPHKAIINIGFSIYRVGATGEMENLVPRQTLDKEGLKSKILTVRGNSYRECIEELKLTLDKILRVNKKQEKEGEI